MADYKQLIRRSETRLELAIAYCLGWLASIDHVAHDETEEGLPFNDLEFEWFSQQDSLMQIDREELLNVIELAGILNSSDAAEALLRVAAISGLSKSFLQAAKSLAVVDGPVNEDEFKVLAAFATALDAPPSFLEEFSMQNDAIDSTESALAGSNSNKPERVTAKQIQDSGLSETRNAIASEAALKEGLAELNAMVGVDGVKQEVRRLMNFLNIRQQRIDQGMTVPKQSLHFVFTGNPGTGKTTVARIVAKIMYGFQILETPNLVEADRAAMVGGYLGQTAIKTQKLIEKATNGVLFIDEAYTLAKSGGRDYGQEAIDTLLKQMEDLRDKMIVIVAGYPNEMAEFIGSNPGLESRFTRYIQFDDYHVAELCQIFDRMCAANEYRMTQEARANLAILLNRAFVNRDRNFGNARFVRNAYEQVLGNQSDRLASSDAPMTKELLQMIEADDLPYDLADGIKKPFDVSQSKWIAQCPKCEQILRPGVAIIGQVVKCKCGTRFRCPWWNLEKKTVPGLVGFNKFERPTDLIGYEIATG